MTFTKKQLNKKDLEIILADYFKTDVKNVNLSTFIVIGGYDGKTEYEIPAVIRAEIDIK